MIYIINTILFALFLICALLPLTYCLFYIYDFVFNKEKLKINDTITFWFCFLYFLACSFIIFRLLGFG